MKPALPSRLVVVVVVVVVAVVVVAVIAGMAGCTKPVPRHARFVEAGDGDVASIVRAAAQKADAQGRRALVYVGASWCEPCRRLHDAVARGALDDVVGDVDFVQFDLDRDRKRLDAADCDSEMIPLVAVVDAQSGRCSRDERMAGSIKGDGAVAQMTPRLRALLAHH